MKTKTNNTKRSVIAAERRIEALKLRTTGMYYSDIADELGVCLATAYNDVMDRMKELNSIALEEAQVVRDLEVARLDKAMLSIKDKLDEGDLAAINTLLRIQERRARFLGLDMPNKSELTIDTPEPITFILDDGKCQKSDSE